MRRAAVLGLSALVIQNELEAELVALMPRILEMLVMRRTIGEVTIETNRAYYAPAVTP